jgi:hypothetical protein
MNLYPRIILFLMVCTIASAQQHTPRRLATGNLSVDEIMRSPVGAHPAPETASLPPVVDALRPLVTEGLQVYEDYLAWGMVELAEGKVDWSHHDAVQEALAAAELPYTPYIWCHVPPTWLRDDPRASLMRCNLHDEPTHIFSIFDPRTLEWYERFYRALHEHFEDRIAEVYACILGPYGEGNYPLPYSDFVLNLGHRHEGYWCGDRYALPAFRVAMRSKYNSIEKINRAWATTFTSFEEVEFPGEIQHEKLPPFVESSPQDRRRWLDFITWYHQALVDFADESIARVVNVFGRERVATKPGGNAGWMNPLSWGTYCPAFAKVAGRHGITVQAADAHGAYWADKWSSTAYRFYGVPFRTEGAGAMDRNTFVRRLFADVSCGASGLFTYDIEKHMPDANKWLHLYRGEAGRTQVAFLAPTTDYFLNADVMPLVQQGMKLRDHLDYDVLDELLVRDGAADHYRILVVPNVRFIERDVIDVLTTWVRRGGMLVVSSEQAICDVEGNPAEALNSATSTGTRLDHGVITRAGTTVEAIAEQLGAITEPVDGVADEVWVTEFSDRLLLLNRSTEQRASRQITWRGRHYAVALEPLEIVEVLPE